MAKPGKHQYLVQFEDFENIEEYSCSKETRDDVMVQSTVDQMMEEKNEKLGRESPLGSKLSSPLPRQQVVTKYCLNNCLVQPRVDEVVPFAKVGRRAVNLRKFIKETSVFRDWRLDTKASNETSFQTDISYWKIHRVVKNVDDYDKVVAVLQRHFKTLKKIFISEAAQSGFPCINWIKYSDFCGDAGIID